MKNMLSVMLFVCFVSASSIVAASDDIPVLTEVHQKITSEFNRLDIAMQDAARKLGTSGLTGDDARKSLAELCGKFSFSVDCSAIDARGVMVTVEPSAYSNLEGTDISAQKQVRTVIKKHKPVMRSIFKTVEGFPAVDVEYPIVDSQGKYIGSVSLLFKPETLFSQLLPPLLKGIPVDIWAMDAGGRIIYDVDISEIGQNLFTSEAYQPYTELLKLGRRIASNPEGCGGYRYKVHGENIAAARNACWKTVALYGTEWRIVGIHVKKEISGSRSKQVVPPADPVKMLVSFAKDGRLIGALSHENKLEAMKRLEAFYHATPGIYAVEWIDTKGINRFGYPVGNTLVDYDYHQLREIGDPEILDLLNSRKRGRMQLPLTEGGNGIFDFIPVMDGNNYLGLIYIIRCKP
jgi:hypothetical protein